MIGPILLRGLMIGKLFVHVELLSDQSLIVWPNLQVGYPNARDMAAAGTSTAFTVSVVFFLLTFGSCYVIPVVGDEMGLMTGYDALMPMMLGAFVFAPLGCLFLLGGLVGSLFPSTDKESDDDQSQPTGTSSSNIPNPVLNDEENE